MRMTTTNRIVAALMLGLSMTACSTWDDIMTSEQVDYKSTVKGEPLALPPDLSRDQIRPQYSTNDGEVSAVAYSKAVDKANKQRAEAGGVLPQNGDMRVMRSGDKRWLQVDRDATAVYKDIISFWTDEGFTINRDDPQVGLIETDWAENRAKIPGNFLRRALGSLVDVVSDSGERERFTTRLERVNGKTEVYIRHERMEETQMDRDGTVFKWLPAPEDQEVNAIMLARLMAYMGLSKEQAKQAVASPQNVLATQPKANFVDGQTALSVTDSKENTYRQLGQALTTTGFTIDKSDANVGNYVVRYLDTDTGEKRKAANIISRLWDDKGNLTPVPYTINVTGSNSQSVITVRDANGNLDNSETARRILTVIRENF